MTAKPKLSRPATFPAVVRLTYATVYGYNFAIDPGAPLPDPGSDPRTWGDYPVTTVVRLAPYNAADATPDQQAQYDGWVDNDDDPDAPAATYWFAALRTDEAFGPDGTPSHCAYRVEVLPGYLCGLDA